jgi:hypothetical protein
VQESFQEIDLQANNAQRLDTKDVSWSSEPIYSEKRHPLTRIGRSGSTKLYDNQ